MRTPRIAIDYTLCGDGRGVDPRSCARCLRACAPAVFLMHQSFDVPEPDPLDPKAWRITVMWPTLCTRCMGCVSACPANAVTVK
ncbi:MAG TPA: 4Fe-4S binding protein [Spirochaetia bacterium]|nr:4Fe-4S binding protein [Spirochaetia bacterium]